MAAALLAARSIPVRIVDEGIDWPAWISALASLLTLIVVALTAVAAYGALRDARRTRHGELITELSRQWSDPAVVQSIRLHGEYSAASLDALVERLFGPADEKPQDEGDWSKLAVWANLVESMGVLVSEGAITNETVYKMWGGGIMRAWSLWEPAVLRLREIEKQPDTFQYFEKIGGAMLSIARQRTSAGEEVQAATSNREASASHAVAAAAPEKSVHASSAPPSRSFAADVPNSSPSVTRRRFRLVVALIVLSTIARRLVSAWREA
ncbi:MAG: DUF4760 domain-containing protein [Actinomycetota bacterium]|nr:DUF4760 domain-containing protein [Actinomycetota bacterium]